MEEPLLGRNINSAPLPAAAGEKKTWHRCPWSGGTIVRVGGVVLFAAGVVFCLIYFHGPIESFLGNGGTLQKFVKRIGWWGPVVFAAVYAVCTVACIPGSLLTLGAGVVFNDGHISSLFLAFGVVVVGATVGAMLAFLLGGSLLRSWVLVKIEDFPSFAATQRAISAQGTKMVLLLRLAPVFPFVILNYALGVTEVSFAAYSFSTFFGIMPGSLLYVYIGWASVAAASGGSSAASSPHESHKTKLIKAILMYGVGSVVTLIVVVWVSIIAKRAVNRAITREQLALDAEVIDRSDFTRNTSPPRRRPGLTSPLKAFEEDVI